MFSYKLVMSEQSLFIANVKVRIIFYSVISPGSVCIISLYS